MRTGLHWLAYSERERQHAYGCRAIAPTAREPRRVGPGLHRPGEPVLTIDEAANAVTLDIPLLGEVYELEIGYNA
jgi:hypothetical protein